MTATLSAGGAGVLAERSCAPSQPTLALRTEDTLHGVIQEGPWLQEVGAKLGELLNLKRDWDSYGAEPINQACLSAALELLLDVMRDESPAPSVVPTRSGGVQLEWHTKAMDLEVEVHSPSRIEAYCESNGTDWEADVTSDRRRLERAINELTTRA